MIKPSTCIFHKLGTPILSPHSLCLFRLKAPTSLCPHMVPSSSLPPFRKPPGASLCPFDWPFGEETCSGHLRIWHTTVYVRVECGFSLPFLSLGDIPLQILSDDPQCLDCPNVADWVAALVGWPKNGIWRAGAPHMVRKGRVRLQGMASKKYLKYTDGNIVFLLPSIQITNWLENALAPLQIHYVAPITQSFH